MDLGHKAMKNPSDDTDLGFQAIGPALRIMQLNVEGLSAAKRNVIQSLADSHLIESNKTLQSSSTQTTHYSTTED